MNDIELIKSKIDIVEFISEFIPLKRAGRNFKANCPFHSERTPSFFVSPERGTWHCFGACGDGGDAIKFLQKWENIEFPDALKMLAKKTGVTLSQYSQSDEGREREKLYEINHLASEYYHYVLVSHKLGEKARTYLKSRFIKDETIKTFMLGYSPDSWDSLFKYLVKKGYQAADIYKAGLLSHSQRGTYFDRFRGRLMFTLRDHHGNAVGFSGRKLAGDEKEAKYINTAETPIYIKGNLLYGLEITKEAIKREKKTIVVEGEFDCLASFQAGASNVVAIKGSALTEGQVLLLKRYTENIILGLDSDFAGNEAARRGIEIAEGAGLIVKVAKVLYGKDPAECVAKDPSLWKKSLKEAVPVYDFIIDNAFAKYGEEGIIGKKKIGNEILPFLVTIDNTIVLSHYVKLLARRLEVSEESIEMAIAAQQKKSKLVPVVTVEQPKKERQELLEEYVLSLVTQSQKPHEILEKVMTVITPEDFNELPVRKIFELLSGYLKNHESFDVKDFSGLLTTEIEPTFDRAYLRDMESALADKAVFDQELRRAIYGLKKLALRRKLHTLSTKLQTEEESGDTGKIGSLQVELRELLARISEVDKIRI